MQSSASIALVKHNIIEGDASSWVETDPLLVCGNGKYDAPSNAFTLYKNGNMTIAGTLTHSSDIRLKEAITSMENVLESLNTITPITNQFKDTHTHLAGRQIGFSAQEIQKDFPELV